MKLDEIMFNLSEALLNLKDNYPNRGEANRSYGALMSYLNYKPQKMVIVINEDTDCVSLRPE